MNIEQRSMSSFNLSIGTSLAMESFSKGPSPLYDPLRKIPVPVKAMGFYNVVYINVVTLLRNMIGAMEVPPHMVSTSRADELAAALAMEMEVLDGIISTQCPNCTVNYYVNDFSAIHRVNKPEKVRLANTDKQKHAIRLTNVVIPAVVKYRGDIQHFTSYPKTIDRTRGLILTHAPTDLLSYQYFTDLHLLESHTGVVKTMKDRYTKLITPGKLDLSMMPFNRITLFVFGDPVVFKPAPIRLRREFVEAAGVLKWSIITSTRQMIKDAETYHVVALKHYLDTIPKF